jgi:hypothetical protein
MIVLTIPAQVLKTNLPKGQRLYKVAMKPKLFHCNVTEMFVTNGFEYVLNKPHIKNGIFWDVTPRGSYKNRRFRGT